MQEKFRVIPVLMTTKLIFLSKMIYLECSELFVNNPPCNPTQLLLQIADSLHHCSVLSAHCSLLMCGGGALSDGEGLCLRGRGSVCGEGLCLRGRGSVWGRGSV